MSGFVTVWVWDGVAAPAGIAGGPSAGALVLNVKAPCGTYVVAARSAHGGTGHGRDPGTGDGLGACTDQHFAVDASRPERSAPDLHADSTVREACWRRRQKCADVLYDSGPRTPAEATQRLAYLMAAHPGCGLVALPLVGGGWAAVGSGSQRVVVVALGPQVPHGDPLFASCLHGWLVSGHALDELADARTELFSPARSGERVRAPAAVQPVRP